MKEEINENKTEAEVIGGHICARCGQKAGNFIWTTSRQINAGIRAMYPDSKLCPSCLEELQSVYPPVHRDDRESLRCIHCGGKIKEQTIGLGDAAVIERYCEDCGIMLEDVE